MTIARSVSTVTKGVASAVTRGQGAGGAASLDIRASVGTSTSPTSTGTKAVTGVGFQPKVVLPWGHGDNNTGALTHALVHLGAMTASAQAAIGASSVNAVTTSATHRRHSNAHAVSTVYNNLNSINAAYSAFGSDGFTLDWSAVTGVATILNHIALGGADLEVSLTQQQMNGTNAAQSFAHGLSGAPTGVLFFFAQNTTAPANTGSTLGAGIGAWSSASQFGAHVYSQTGVTTSNTSRTLVTSGVIPVSGATKQLARVMSVSTVDATNVNVTYPTTIDSQQYYFFMLAIRGAKCQVGTFNTASSNTIVTTGLTPKLFIPVFIPSGVASAGSVLNDLCLSIGASDGTNNVSCGITDANAVTTTNARRFQSSTTLQERNTAGTVQFEATAAFSGESIVVTPTTALTNFGQAGYIAIGS